MPRNQTGPPELISPPAPICISHAHAQQNLNYVASSPPFAAHRIHRAFRKTSTH